MGVRVGLKWGMKPPPLPRPTIGTYCTTVSPMPDDTTVVMLHSTPIVSLTALTVMLNSGGWQTAVTKRRMNQVSRAHRLDWTVVQRGGQWFVLFDSGDLRPFTDHMTFARKERQKCH